MKTKRTKSAKIVKKFPRLPVIAAIGVIGIAAITVVSRQSATGKQKDGPPKVATAVASTAGSKYTTVKVAGQDVQVDGQTGMIRPLTQEEAKKLAQGLKGMLNKSNEGLVEEHNADGSVSMDLQGRFQNVVVARENKDGSVSTECIDNPGAAARFFGIDRKLLEVDGPQSTPNN